METPNQNQPKQGQTPAGTNQQQQQGQANRPGQEKTQNTGNAGQPGRGAQQEKEGYNSGTEQREVNQEQDKMHNERDLDNLSEGRQNTSLNEDEDLGNDEDTDRNI